MPPLGRNGDGECGERVQTDQGDQNSALPGGQICMDKPRAGTRPAPTKTRAVLPDSQEENGPAQKNRGRPPASETNGGLCTNNRGRCPQPTGENGNPHKKVRGGFDIRGKMTEMVKN